MPGGVRVEVVGELDAYTVRQLSRTLTDCAAEGHARVEVDLTDVGFLDSTAALALVEAADRLGDGRALTVVGASSPVLDVLRVADPSGRLDVSRGDGRAGSVDVPALDD